ncbi:MAG TPA: DNA mismatch repair protein MutS, partial [Bacteroidia bacterium]|nr:DNA mismatch repair protein MutS [Bacteroidia bacterium]
ADQLNACSILTNQINQTITDEPPAIINKGGTIKNGINEALDALRNIAGNGKAYLVELQKREAESTGIPSLKVSYNHVFGYYIEVTNTHKNKVPTHWHRKQTLANAERYITPELKQYEEEILGAEEKILGLEESHIKEIFDAI